MDLSISAVKSRLFRARKKMAQIYQKKAEALPPLSKNEPKQSKRSGREETFFVQIEQPVMQMALVGV